MNPSIAVALVALAAASPAAAADPPGAKLFEQCAVCHSIGDGGAEVGPNLKGLFGRKAGASEGFPYSRAMQRSETTWSAETLDRFLADPQAAIPGNRMPFSGMASKDDRTALITYLQTATQ